MPPVLLLFACCLVQSVILNRNISHFFFCFRLSSAVSFGAAPFVSCAGRIADLAPGHLVRLLDRFEYRVIRINPTSQNVTLKKINAPQNRPFVRPANQFWVTPPTPLSISVSVTEPTEKCLCSSPLLPFVLPNTFDVAVGASMDAEEAMELLVTELDSVQRLQKGFEEARAAANNTFQALGETVQELREKETNITDLNHCLTALNEENSSLLARTLELTEQVSSFKAVAVNPQLHEAYKEMLLHQLSTYPTTLDFAPESMLYDLLCCLPTSSADTLNSRAHHILLLIHRDKNLSAPTSTAPLVTIVQEAKTILLNRHLRQFYNCCGVDGLRRAQQRLRTCMVCNPSVIAYKATVSL